MMDECISMKWSEVYSLGDQKVDAEHKRLFELAAIVEDSKDNKKQLELAVKELVRYTKFHFKSEENYMRELDYSNLEEHIQIHEQIVENLNTIVKNMPNEPYEKTYEMVYDFVKNGLVQHIIIEDKKLQHFKRSRLGLRAFFTWKESYKLFDEKIDEEHKKLFQIAMQALKHKDNSTLKAHVRKVIINLNDYMKIHFEHEEEFMNSIGYPGLEEHKIIHQNIINQINDLIKNIATLSLVDFEKTLMTYIDIWLVNHIIFEDKKIMCYYHNQTSDLTQGNKDIKLK